MSGTQNLFSTVANTDPLHFGEGNALNYRSVAEFLDLNEDSLSKLSGVSKNSVRFDHRIPQDLKNHLEQIANICSLVAEFFDGNSERTALWFKTPNPMLGGVTPRDMIRIGRYKKLLNFVSQAREENEEQAQ